MIGFIKYLFREIKLVDIRTNESAGSEVPIKNVIEPITRSFRSTLRSFKESMEELKEEYKHYKNIG